MVKFRHTLIDLDAALFDGVEVGEPNGRGGVIKGSRPAWFPGAIDTIDARNAEFLAPGRIARSDVGIHFGAVMSTLTAYPGDWIVRGADGRIYPQPRAAFEKQFKELDASGEIKQPGEVSG